MKIGIYSSKGGVGKTSLGFSIAKDIGFRYITNDLSIVISKLEGAKLYPKNIPIYENSLYDFGGFDNKQSREALEQMDLILIPTVNDANSILRTLMAIKKNINIPIIIIPNIIESKKDLEIIKLVLNHHYENIRFAPIRKGLLLKRALESGSSATEIYNESEKSKYHYRNSFLDYKLILDILKGFQENNDLLKTFPRLEKRIDPPNVSQEIIRSLVSRGIQMSA